MRKGQGALEYLMTYGWALLIIVVVGAALYALGVFTPSAKSTCTGLTYFDYQGQKLTTSTYDLVIVNGNTDVEITGLQIGPEGSPTTLTMSYQNVSAGKKATLSGTGWGGGGKSAGDTFSYEVIIQYDTTDLTGKSDRGSCSGIVE